LRTFAENIIDSTREELNKERTDLGIPESDDIPPSVQEHVETLDSLNEIEQKEQDTPRQLEGRYYLTKIAHLLLPESVHDVYQVGESPDETKTGDAERITLTPAQKRLQEIRQSGGDDELVQDQLVEELGDGWGDLNTELGDIGLDIQNQNLDKYSKDKAGKVYYLDTFKPWQVDPVVPSEFEVLFSEMDLRIAIEEISDEETKEECHRYLDRLLILLEEDKQEHQKNYESSLLESGPYIEELETMFVAFEQAHPIEDLRSITTEEEASNSEVRESASRELTPIISLLKILGKGTNITSEEYNELDKRYKILSRAVGAISHGLVDHDR